MASTTNSVPEEDTFTYHKHDTYRAWDSCTALLEKRENEQVEAWKNEVENLLSFAGTFLTVNTLFIDSSSGALEPDDARTTVEVLYTISRQLNGTHTVAIPQPFERKLLDVIQCSFIFASLLLSLIAAGLGLWVKEWLREYLLDLPNSPRELVHVRQFRHRGIHRWRMRQHVSTISFLLNVAIALFSVGLMLFARKIDLTLYSVLIGLLGLWAILTWVTALFPAASASCPYRSPFSRWLYVLVHRATSVVTWRGARKEYESLVNYERHRAKDIGTELEVEALEYINREYWGHEKLSEVNRCFKDVKPSEAKTAIQDIIVARLTKDHGTFVDIRSHETRRHELSNPPSDEDTLALLRMWDTIPSEPTPGQSDWAGTPSADDSVGDTAPQPSREKPLSDEELLQVLRMWCAGQTEPPAPEYASKPDSELWKAFKEAINRPTPPVRSDSNKSCWRRPFMKSSGTHATPIIEEA